MYSNKKLMWYEMVNEFNCKASSTWTVCGRERGEAFTHKHLSPDKKGEISQLDYIIGPMTRNDEAYIHNEGRLWATWDNQNSAKKKSEKRSGLDTEN